MSQHRALNCGEGGISASQNIPEDKIGDKNLFFFSFCSSRETEVFRKHNSITFLGSTHDTCFTLWRGDRRAFLYTVLVKYDVASCGLPVAFIIINYESQRPLSNCLGKLKVTPLILESQKIMIACSSIEIAPIEFVFVKPKIHLCHWHLLREM